LTWGEFSAERDKGKGKRDKAEGGGEAILGTIEAKEFLDVTCETRE
jgi:hypothetical protein